MNGWYGSIDAIALLQLEKECKELKIINRLEKEEENERKEMKV